MIFPPMKMIAGQPCRSAGVTNAGLFTLMRSHEKQNTADAVNLKQNWKMGEELSRR